MRHLRMAAAPFRQMARSFFNVSSYYCFQRRQLQKIEYSGDSRILKFDTVDVISSKMICPIFAPYTGRPYNSNEKKMASKKSILPGVCTSRSRKTTKFPRRQ